MATPLTGIIIYIRDDGHFVTGSLESMVDSTIRTP